MEPAPLTEVADVRERRIVLTVGAATKEKDLRRGNQDTLYQSPSKSFLVGCDGMGGHAGGKLASETAVRVYCEACGHLKVTSTVNEAKKAFAKANQGANAAIAAKVKEDPSCRGMGTTIVAAAVVEDGNKVVLSWAGDTRGLLIRDGKCYRLTTDHNFTTESLEMLVRNGKMTQSRAQLVANCQTQATFAQLTTEEKRILHRRNVLTRALGQPEGMGNTQSRIVDLRPGDRLVIMVDGVYQNLPRQEMESILKSSSSPAEIAAGLVSRAHSHSVSSDSSFWGAHPDDISAIVLALEKSTPIAETENWADFYVAVSQRGLITQGRVNYSSEQTRSFCEAVRQFRIKSGGEVWRFAELPQEVRNKVIELCLKEVGQNFDLLFKRIEQLWEERNTINKIVSAIWRYRKTKDTRNLELIPGDYNLRAIVASMTPAG